MVDEAAQAAAAGDRDGYVACFTPRSRALVRAFWRAAEASRPALAGLGAGTVTVGEPRTLAPGRDRVPRAQVMVSEAGAEIPLVLHRLSGAWRIDLVDSERALTGLAAPF